MRILHISKYSYPARGGIETFVRDLTTEQVHQGHSVSVLCHHATPLKRADTRQIDGVRITRASTFCNTAVAPISPFFSIYLRKIVSLQRPQVIHIHLPNPAVLFNSFFPSEIPYIVHWHADVKGSPSTLINTFYPVYRIFESRCLSKAKRIIATSPPYLRSSRTLTSWRDKCEIIPLGLDQSKYTYGEYHKAERPLIISVGRFSFYKGFENLVRAAALVPEADFIIAGDGPEYAKISNEIKTLGLTERVHLLGNISDSKLCVLLQQATVFCLPSVDRGEAFGIVLLEAMRYGVPLISTDIIGSGTSWVNQNDVTGLVVPPASPASLAGAIRNILNHPEDAIRYGQAGKQRIKDEFTISKIAKSINQIYEKTLE